MSFIMKYKEASLADDMAEERRANAWDSLVVVHHNHLAEDDFLSVLKGHENEYMDEMYKHTPEAKKANGEWKYRKFNFKNSSGEDQTGGLPMAYMSAKSTIVQARQHGVSLKDDMGEARSKDKLTKALKEVKDVRTPFQKALNLVVGIEKLWPELNVDEQEAVSIAYGLITRH